MARRTRREILREQAERAFIGRQDVLLSFRANVSSDEPPRVLFAISGEGGVGKSSLLDQLERDAVKLDVPVLVIRCDDRQPFPVDVIARAAEHLARLELKSPEARKLQEQQVKKVREQLARHGNLRRDIESDDDAPPHLVRAVELDPDDAGNAAGSALVHLAAAEIQGAKAAFTKLATLQFEYADAAGVLATWRNATGDSEQAVVTAQSALELKVTDAGDQLGRCLALVVLGRTDEARELAQGPIAGDHEVMTWVNRIDLFEDVRRLIADR